MTTQEKLMNAIKDVDGNKESVCIIYTDNANHTCRIGFVGDFMQIASAISHKIVNLPNAKGEAECVFVNAIMQAVAVADYNTGGVVVEVIKEIKKKNIEMIKQKQNMN